MSIKDKRISETIRREMFDLAGRIQEEQVSAYILRLSELLTEESDEEVIAGKILEEMGN